MASGSHDQTRRQQRKHRARAIILALIAIAGGLAGCSPVGLFNAVVPYDAGADRIGEAIAYGPHPRHRLDIYAPPGAKNRPVVLFLYGGSWRMGERGEYAFVGRALAARGFVVAVADYRLVPQTRFPGFVEDAARALGWLGRNAEQYGGSPRNMFLMGHSAGAQIALLAALDRRYLDAAGVPQASLAGAVGLSGPYDFFPFDVPASIKAFAHWPRPAETQPITFASAAAPPVLLATGDQDDTVRPGNTRALADRLRSAGAPVEEKTYPGVGHAGTLVGIARPFRGRAPILDDVADFIRRRSQASGKGR